MVLSAFLYLLSGLVVSAALVPAARWASPVLGLVTRPAADRWGTREVGKLGGVAIALALGLVLLASGTWGPLWPLLTPAALMFGLGLIDDIRPVRPATKLVGQVLIVALLMYLAPPITLTGHVIADYLLAFLWVIGLTNAFNLLDNIDGLAAGVAAIAATFLTATLLMDGTPALTPLVLALSAFVGVTLGFLLYNFQPASIFMGDSGSHLLGFMIAASTLLAVPHLSPTALVPAAITPVVILLIPIFDTAFVMITRGLAGRSIFSGGRDHTSHRLVALGIGERRAVLVLYALALTGGLVALSVHGDGARYTWALVALYATLLAGLGIYLGHTDASHPETGDTARRPLLPTELTNRFRAYEVALDALLIAVAYYLAFGLRFAEPEFSHFLPYFARSLPVVLGLQLAGLALAGKYRQTWQSFGASELRSLLQGVALGVGATVIAVVYLYRFQGFSRAVFVLDAALLPVFLIGARALFSAADDYLRRTRAGGRMALIVGAGRGGALVVRELLQNADLGYVPLGFVDDDPAKQKQRVDGYRVLGTVARLADVLDTHRQSVAVVIVAIRELTTGQFGEICAVCDARGIGVRRMRFALEEADWRDRTPGVIKFPGR